MRLICAFFLLVSFAKAQFPEAPSSSSFFHDRAQMSAVAVGFAAHACDLGQTFYHMDHATWIDGKAYYGRETWLPTQNKGAISAALLGSEAMTTYVQYRFYRSGHPRLGIFTQYLAAGVSGTAIYSSFHSKYGVAVRP